MPVPTRPVDGAEIATEWGQAVHDYTFAPTGCEVNGGVVAMAAAAANTILPIDTGNDDPGGWLDAANDRIEAPDDAEGLYIVRPFVAAVDGGGSDEIVAELLFNGTNILRMGPVESLGATTIPVTGVTWVRIVPGDIMQVRARQVGSGARADVDLRSLLVMRVGAELGTP